MGLSARAKGAVIEVILGPGAARLQRRLARARRGDGLTLYHRIDDPYSQLLVQLLPSILPPEVEVAVDVVGQVGLELDPAPEQRRAYALRDAREIAERYGVSLPGGDLDATSLTGGYPPAPLVARAHAVLCHAPSLALALELGEATWGRDDAKVEQLAARHGAVVDVDAALQEGTRRQRRRGHYQAGMIHFCGDWYWGPDRLGTLSEDMLELGMTPLEPLEQVALPTIEAAPSDAELELYFSFRSPYSYLALERCGRLAGDYDVPLRIKPVLPMVMRGHAVPLVKRLFIVRDAARQARRLDVPFGRICDPLGGGVERCLALFDYAEREGGGLAFCRSAGRAIWSEAMDLRRDDELAEVVERAGLSWTDGRAALDDPGWRGRCERHRLELRSMGLWGVPSFRFGEASAWGQDRLGRVEEWLAVR